MSVERIQSDRTRRWRGVCLLVVLAGVACTGRVGRADTVIDPRGVFAEVTVVGMDDGKLVFRFKDGRTLSRAVLEVKEIVVASGTDAAADELTRAEALRREKQYEQAAALYERTRSLAGKEWIRAYATFRLVDTYAELGRFQESVESYLAVTEKHPSLIAGGVPRKRPDAAAAGPILLELDRRETAGTTETQRRAIARMRSVLEGGAASEPGGDAKPTAKQRPTRAPEPARPVGRKGTPGEKRAGEGRASTQPGGAGRGAKAKRETLPRMSRVTAGVYKKLGAGQRVEAWDEIEKGLRAATTDAPGSRDVWWLVEAEYELSAGQALAAGLAAMKVVAVMPESPYFAEALLLAGRAYETIRPSKARSLYEECQKHATADEAIRREAAGRLAAMEKVAATQRVQDKN